MAPRIPAEDFARPTDASSKFKPPVVERILASLRNGNPRFVAAAAGGINPATLRLWLKDRPEFAEQVVAAEASAVAGHISIINRAATNGDWRASIWWLERRYPEEFGSVSRVEIIQRHRQAERIADELSRELGRTITVEELLSEADLARPALPAPGARNLRRGNRRST